MIISLRLKNFRRFKDECFTLVPGINFIEGRNNAGKTTLFYAIEYALFGRVGSFRSQSALMFPGSRTVGVEIIFKGRSGHKYRLQRIHTRPPKARTKVIGHFTLKQFVDDTGEESGEKYLLSSDFQDHEESLALKLHEILGITHKLFNVAVNLRQGEIASILEGAPQLDIVLGVTASVLASEEMRAMALEREHECKNLPMFEESVRRLDSEKQDQGARQKNLETEIKNLETLVDSLSGVEEWNKQAQNLVLPVRSARQGLADALNTMEYAHREFERTKKQLDELTANFGALEQIQQARESVRGNESELTLEKEKAGDRLAGFADQKSDLDTERGDLSGRISRRQALLSNDRARCETCGQIIDRALNEQEIEAWTLDLAKTDKELQELAEQTRETRAALEKTESQLKASALEDRELAHAESALKNISDMIGKQEKEIADTSEKLAKSIDTVFGAAESCAEQCAVFSETTKNPDIAFNFDKASFGDAINTGENPAITGTNILESLNRAIDELDDKLKASIVRMQTELKGILANKERMENDLEILARRMADIDRELAGVRGQVENLKTKEFAAKRLRTLATGFKDLQIQLRENASAALAESTFQLYQALSEPDSELKSLAIDPKRYSVQVIPFDIGKEVPAHLYQGGGHKLLLGLAFKMAVAGMVGPCPFALLDEPTYGLDESHRGNLLKRIADLGITGQMLLITHHEIGEVPGRHIRIIRKGKASTQDSRGNTDE
ncbi:MAG: AAA family ATPase [Desulfobacteraceae bacterium]|nr:AAA family ATPase [Desulfobacteraceae bacterium]